MARKSIHACLFLPLKMQFRRQPMKSSPRRGVVDRDERSRLVFEDLFSVGGTRGVNRGNRGAERTNSRTATDREWDSLIEFKHAGVRRPPSPDSVSISIVRWRDWYGRFRLAGISVIQRQEHVSHECRKQSFLFRRAGEGVYGHVFGGRFRGTMIWVIPSVGRKISGPD